MRAASLWRDESGSALIEVAVTLPLLMVVLGGTIDLGVYEETKMQVTEAANAAAGFGAQGNNQLNSSGMQTAAQNASPSLSHLSFSSSSVWTCTSGGQAVTSTTDCGNGESPLQYVRVQTSSPVNAPIQVSGVTSSLTVSALAIYRVRWKPS